MGDERAMIATLSRRFGLRSALWSADVLNAHEVSALIFGDNVASCPRARFFPTT